MGRVGIVRVALALAVWTGLAAFALADDWMVDRLRGEVLVMRDGSWSALQRGDIVSDSSRIRSVEGSRVTFTRGAEAIELNGATEVRIFDRQGERMTTIMQAYGTVTVEAERLQIQHFSVQTPFLAAIVKGTRFTVHSDDVESSVDVARGLVQVQDYVHGVATDITPGQSAVVSDEVVLAVSGHGAKAATVTLDGQLVPPANERSVAAQSPGHGANGSHGNGAIASGGMQGHAYGNSGQGNGNAGSGNNADHGSSNAGGGNGNAVNGSDNGNAMNGAGSGNDNSMNGNSAAGSGNSADGNGRHNGN